MSFMFCISISFYIAHVFTAAFELPKSGKQYLQKVGSTYQNTLSHSLSSIIYFKNKMLLVLANTHLPWESLQHVEQREGVRISEAPSTHAQLASFAQLAVRNGFEKGIKERIEKSNLGEMNGHQNDIYPYQIYQAYISQVCLHFIMSFCDISHRDSENFRQIKSTERGSRWQGTMPGVVAGEWASCGVHCHCTVSVPSMVIEFEFELRLKSLIQFLFQHP